MPMATSVGAKRDASAGSRKGRATDSLFLFAFTHSCTPDFLCRNNALETLRTVMSSEQLDEGPRCGTGKSRARISPRPAGGCVACHENKGPNGHEWAGGAAASNIKSVQETATTRTA